MADGYVIDFRKENIKIVGKTILYIIIAALINIIFYFALNSVVMVISTTNIGERTIELVEGADGKTYNSVVSEHYFNDTEATTQGNETTTTPKTTSPSENNNKAGEQEDDKDGIPGKTTVTTMPENQLTEKIRSDVPKSVNDVAGFIMQIFMIIILGALLYTLYWKIADIDSNRIKFGRMKEDKFRGLKFGMIAAIPTFITHIILIINKISEIIPNYLIPYRFLNVSFLPLINSFTGVGVESNDMSRLSILNIIVLTLTTVAIPIATHWGYTFGRKHTMIKERFIYASKDKKKR